MQNLWKTYHDITGILQKRKFCCKWCHSGNPLTEAVEYFELKITDNQSDDFSRMLSKNDLSFFKENLRKSYLPDLQKTYENLTTNLGKISKSFENGPQVLFLTFLIQCRFGSILKHFFWARLGLCVAFALFNQSINQFISHHSTEVRATVRLCRCCFCLSDIKNMSHQPRKRNQLM